MTVTRLTIPFTDYRVELQSGAADTYRAVNINDVERMASVIIGGALAVWGLGRAYPGLVLLLIGGGLIYRGTSGHCQIYKALGLNTSDSPSQLPSHSSVSRAVEKPLLDDPIDAAMDDSFPASDPPAFNA